MSSGSSSGAPDTAEPADGSARDSNAEIDHRPPLGDCTNVATPCNLAPDSHDTEGIVVNGAVYFTERRAVGAIRVVDASGGAVTTLATSPMPASIAVVGAISSACGAHDCTSPVVVAWISEEPGVAALHRLDRQGSSARCCPSLPSAPVSVSGSGRVITAGAGGFFLWSSSGADVIATTEAFYAPLASSEIQAPGSPLALAEVDGALYWAQHSAAGEVHRRSSNSGPSEVLGGTDGGPGRTYSNIEAIAASSSTVAWTSASGVYATKTDSSSFADASAVELIDPAADGRGIVVKGDVVFYLAGGELRRRTRGIANSGQTIATVCAGYRWLASDDARASRAKALFWTCGADGGVFRRSQDAP